MPRRSEILGHTGKIMKRPEEGPSDIWTSSLARQVPTKGIGKTWVLTGGKPRYREERLLDDQKGQEEGIEMHRRLEQYLAVILKKEKLPLFKPDTSAVVIADWIKSLLAQTLTLEEGTVLLCTGIRNEILFTLILHGTRYSYNISVKDLYKKYFSK